MLSQSIAAPLARFMFFFFFRRSPLEVHFMEQPLFCFEDFPKVHEAPPLTSGFKNHARRVPSRRFPRSSPPHRVLHNLGPFPCCIPISIFPCQFEAVLSNFFPPVAPPAEAVSTCALGCSSFSYVLKSFAFIRLFSIWSFF